MKKQFVPNASSNMNNPTNPPARLGNKPEFTGTLCSNCHGTNCPSVFFCPCVIYGKNRAHLNEIDDSICSGDCWIFLGFFFFITYLNFNELLLFIIFFVI